MRQLRLLNLCNLLTRYRDGLALQDAVVESVRAGSTIDTLIVLQVCVNIMQLDSTSMQCRWTCCHVRLVSIRSTILSTP